MLRILIFLLLIFSVTCHASSNHPPGSVEWYVEKWNNQDQRRRIASPNYQRQIETRRLLDRSFSTATRPVGTSAIPTYQPQRITAQSFARGMFNALVRKHPIATASVLALGAYECLNSDTGFCIGINPDDEPEPGPIGAGGGYENPIRCPDGGLYLPEHQGIPVCYLSATSLQPFRFSGGGTFSDFKSTPEQACQSWASKRATAAKNDNPSWTGASGMGQYTPPFMPWACKANISATGIRADGTTFPVQLSYTSDGSARGEIGFYCDNPAFPIGPSVAPDDTMICTKPALLVSPLEPGRPITLEDLGYTGYVSDLLPGVQEIDEDVLKDPVTGKPNSDFFDKPKSTPISRRLSDAFKDVASGVAQSDNPSAPHYYPPDLLSDIIESREKFHQRQPFTDPLTNTTVTPDPGENTTNPPYAPPITVNVEGLVVEVQVEVDMNWDEFPGITQEQYEESNNKLSDAYDSVEIPDFESIDGGFIESLEVNPD